MYLEIQFVRSDAPDLKALLAKVDTLVRGVAAITPWEFDDHISRYVEALAKAEELIAVAQADLDAIFSKAEAEPQELSLGGTISLVMALLQVVQLLKGGATYREIFEAVINFLNLLGQGS